MPIMQTYPRHRQWTYWNYQWHSQYYFNKTQEMCLNTKTKVTSFVFEMWQHILNNKEQTQNNHLQMRQQPRSQNNHHPLHWNLLGQGDWYPLLWKWHRPWQKQYCQGYCVIRWGIQLPHGEIRRGSGIWCCEWQHHRNQWHIFTQRKVKKSIPWRPGWNHLWIIWWWYLELGGYSRAYRKPKPDLCTQRRTGLCKQKIVAREQRKIFPKGA